VLLQLILGIYRLECSVSKGKCTRSLHSLSVLHFFHLYNSDALFSWKNAICPFLILTSLSHVQYIFIYEVLTEPGEITINYACNG
jgi:hypothetical protein